ncbi:MAG: ABC transporter ATP-binding protein [Candidatus Jordarchaeum sp.]|uniref:ABC transporter ATP-binding protein n=1 Tax=Candidatus Jordarchaeum sp. TaxID=2823881 RepID=UPI00404A0B13
MNEAILKVKDLNAYYNSVCALKGINFHANVDEIVGIVGPNGAGKTTLLESIAGTHKIREGEIYFLDHRIEHWPVLKRRKLGLMLIPQEGNVFPMMSIKKNLEVSVLYSSREEREKLLDYVYELFPVLWTKRKNNANTLSGGQQKMLAIGIGIAANPRVMLIDEPSIGLAPKLVTRLFDTLKKIKEDSGNTIVLSEQNIKILNIADRLFGLEAGEIKFDEKTENLSRQVIKDLYLGG